MSASRLKIIFPILAILILVSCRRNEEKGIYIGSDLYDFQDFSENKKMRVLIKRTLSKDREALVELSYFSCDGAGCYDLGSVLAQIVYKLGENEFIKLASELNKNQKSNLISLLTAGLEYGDNDHNGTMDDARIKNIFPKLELILKE